ncbi:hypothetical protein [Arthrobacter sp. GMC3]|uniref:hypothetical protein n=1 Tax=Arthrobacter sp. GMC3 TaxID=2058894 RepID=UPI000CE2DDBB|nr:hypothetical protein [Arthrobacter sp. GMC3]
MRRDFDRSLTGKIGRVTGMIGPDTLGEVMLAFQGGTSAFMARPYDGRSFYPVGERVLVMYFEAPQMVYVEAMPEFLKHDE